MCGMSVHPSVNNSDFSLVIFISSWPTKLNVCRMILHLGAESLNPWFCDFIPGGAVKARLLNLQLSVSSLITYYPKLKLHNDNRRWFAQSFSPRFCDSLPGARLLKYSNRFTAYSSYPIELKLGRMSSRHQTAQSCRAAFFDFLSRGAGGRASCNFQID